MEMTTPVITNAGQASEQDPTMQFVMEERLGSRPEDLPNPNSAKYGECATFESRAMAELRIHSLLGSLQDRSAIVL